MPRVGYLTQDTEHIIAVTVQAVSTTRSKPSNQPLERVEKLQVGVYECVDEASSVFKLHGRLVDEPASTSC